MGLLSSGRLTPWLLLIAAGIAAVVLWFTFGGSRGPNFGDPNAPVLVTGHVERPSGERVANAKLQLTVLDFYHQQQGRPPNVLWQRAFVADAAGDFQIRLAPSEIEAVDPAAVQQGEDFNLSVDGSGGSSVHRELDTNTWAGPIPQVVLVVGSTSSGGTAAVAARDIR